ncbi:hypothetical protein M409DRAFT_70612 [Zasmidium cellare ATCC 36951]|uniref:Amidohydrolase-related domain-containing protein n=1 Tax=Zasmidium cellare ATCC 36951 TaxID=1080233 RepID=A0A6A6C4F7_ZASCE|nr:uncharacterized protein M409DRAFT_70612 [Zasmidium cellare ATCC 36951]KAF2160276.1 hypothetical protein M409DRAFT_70612 [Zasmidium cellare ATCC 36951]
MRPPPFAVTLEEHATLPAIGDEIDFYNNVWKTWPAVREALRDFDSRRISDLDGGNVRLQVISSLPGMASINPSGCRAGNDELAAHIARHPGRFAGFAALPMERPEEAAAELKRTVREHGFVGAMVDNNLADGTHYHEKRFWPVFEAAQELDVPIYTHPSPPSAESLKTRFAGPWPTVVSTGIATGCWGWHEDVGLHIIQLFAAGLFKQFPRLKIIIGHMGELIPMMIDRLDGSRFFSKGDVGKFSDVWDRNIWVTSSGMFSVRVLEMLLQVTKKERVLFSIDTPFNASERGLKFLEELAEKEVFESQEELDGFAYGNAVRLLKLDVDGVEG